MSTISFRGKRLYARVRVSAAETATYSLAEAASLTGVRPDVLRYYCRAGLLGRERAITANPTFDDSALYEVRRIERWRRDFGVTRRALPLFCELWRQVERLQSEVRFLRGP
jgi:DNA-binding transcriptional MerR regulator